MDFGIGPLERSAMFEDRVTNSLTLAAVIVGLSLIALACGDDNGAAEGNQTTTLQTTTPPEYFIAHDPSYLGNERPQVGYPRLDGFTNTWASSYVGNEWGSMIVLTRTTSGVREDLLVMFSPVEGLLVDALRLSGDTSQAHLEISCEHSAAILVPNAEQVRYADFDEAIRAWRPGPGFVLEEFDPATRGSPAAC